MRVKALYLLPPSLAALLFCIPAPKAVGCAVAPRRGDLVQIADESAIIVWDSATQTEHFIRRATFSSGARDFGFLVPTPAKPELSEAGDEAFDHLATVTAPKVITQSMPSGGGGGCGCGYVSQPMPAGKAAPQAVEVLETKRVAGLDAAVLKADDAGELAQWLKEHGYETSPALTEWLAPYVKAKWTISAFKIARDDRARATSAKVPAPTGVEGVAPPPPVAGKVSTSALRMSFHTERPFYPYREPRAIPPVISGPSPGRLLRVYFVAGGRMKGVLGEGGPMWPGKVVWAKPLPEADRAKLFADLKLSADKAPEATHLTEFEDRSSPRPGTDDVYYSLDESQAPVERPPVIQYVSGPMPACMMWGALALYMLVPRLLRWRRPA